MNTTTVNAQRDGRVLTVRLDNPPRNLMTFGMIKDLDALTRSIERDRTVRAVVITSGSPDAFLTHFDVEALLAMALATPEAFPAWKAGLVLRVTSALGRVPGLGALLDHSLLAGTRALLQLHGLFLRWNQMDKVFILIYCISYYYNHRIDKNVTGRGQIALVSSHATRCC